MFHHRLVPLPGSARPGHRSIEILKDFVSVVYPSVAFLCVQLYLTHQATVKADFARAAELFFGGVKEGRRVGAEVVRNADQEISGHCAKPSFDIT